MSIEEALGAEEVASKEFPVTFRGFGQHEVRAFLAQVAAELAAARERERLQRERLEAAEARAAARTPTEQEIEAALGQEAGRLLQAAREGAAEIRAKAEEEAARLVREATGEGTRAQEEAESLLARRSEEAEKLAAEILAEAQREAEAQVEKAKAEGREMVTEAQAVRERVLKDLVRRRRVAHQHLEQLRAGRERLLEAYRVVRSTLDEATRELSVAEVEARAAAETAALRAGARPEPSIDELESELSAARDAGLTRARSGSGDRRSAGANGAGDGGRGEATRVWRARPDDAAGEGERRRDEAEPAGAGEAAEAREVPAGAGGPEARPRGAAGEEPEPDEATEARERSGRGEPPAAPEPVGTVLPGEVAEVLAEFVEPVAEAEPVADQAEAAEPVAKLAENVSEADPITEAAEPVAEPVAEEAEPVAEVAEPVAEPVAERVTEVAEPVAEPVTEVAEPVAEPVTEVAEPVAEPVAEVAEPEAEPVAEQAEPVAEPVAEEAEPEPAAAVPAGPSPQQAPGTDVEGIFARIRADRQAAMARAEAVLSQPVGGNQVAERSPAAEAEVSGDEPSDPVPNGVGVTNGERPAEVPHLPVPAADPPAPADDEHVLQERDAQIEPLERVLLRSLKRALADEQNEVLDTLRRHGGAWTLTDLLPAHGDHVARYFAVVTADLEAGAIQGSRGAGGGEAPPVDDLAMALATEVADDLRARLQRALDAADGDEAPLREGISSAYREWKTSWAQPLVRHHLAAAHARGRFAAVPEVPLRWVVDDDEGACPDCDDNALAGPTPKGQPFPTGQEHPPAHVGCRCMVVPEPA